MATLNRAAYDSARTWKCLLGLRLKCPIIPAATIDERHDSDNEADGNQADGDNEADGNEVDSDNEAHGNKADSLSLSVSLFLIGRCILEYLQTVQYEYNELKALPTASTSARRQTTARQRQQYDGDNSITATTTRWSKFKGRMAMVLQGTGSYA